MATKPPPIMRKKDRLLAPRPADPTWVEQLKTAGYPTTVVVIDFEMYFSDEYSLKGKNARSMVEYLMGEEAEVLGVSLQTLTPDSLSPVEWHNNWVNADRRLGGLQAAFGRTLDRCTVVAHNAVFDLSILKWRFNIDPRFVVDTLGLARHWNARTRNGVAELAKRYELTDKGDTKRFKYFTNIQRMPPTNRRAKKFIAEDGYLKRMTPEDQKQLADYAMNDVEVEMSLFKILLPKLSTPKVELAVMRHSLEIFTTPTLRVNQTRAEQLEEEMEAEITSEISALNVFRVSLGLTTVERKDISGENSFGQMMDDALDRADDITMRYKKSTKRPGKTHIYALAKDDPEKAALETHESEYVRLLMSARSAIKSWPLHIARVRRIIQQSKPHEGRLPVPLKYHGAHTGRWSGGEKINLQNLGARGHDLIKKIRCLLEAPPDKTLIIADASQIEARVLAWVAGQDDLLAQFANSEPIYCNFASKIVGWPVRKPRKQGGIPAIEAKHSWARNSIGKIGILGSGFGMGVTRMMEYAKGSLDELTASEIIHTYRKDNKKIVSLWYEIERAFWHTARYGNSATINNKLRFDQTKDCDVIITLPSGRELKYHKIRASGSASSPTLEWHNPLFQSYQHIWGGFLVENVVQAISRDLLWYAIDDLHSPSCFIPLCVHDELIGVVDKGRGEHYLKKAIAALSRPPSWGEGLPLAAEGVVTERYGGH